MSGSNCSMNNQYISQQDCDSNIGDDSSENCFMTIHTLSQYDDSNIFKDMDRDVEDGNIISGYGFTKIQFFYQQNGLK